MLNNYQQNSLQIIFIKMNITIINMSKDKIDELNKCFKILDKNLEYKLIGKNEIGKSVVEIIALMEMIFEDTSTTKYKIEEYNNPFQQAIKSGLFFLSYINDKILKQDLIDIDIYNNFNKFINNHIENIIHNKEEFLFELYIYKWLQKENYIHSSYRFSGFSDNENFDDEELRNFYDKYHRRILDWIINNFDNLDQNPLDKNKNKNKIYYDFINQYKQIVS